MAQVVLVVLVVQVDLIMRYGGVYNKGIVVTLTVVIVALMHVSK